MKVFLLGVLNSDGINGLRNTIPNYFSDSWNMKSVIGQACNSGEECYANNGIKFKYDNKPKSCQPPDLRVCEGPCRKSMGSCKKTLDCSAGLICQSKHWAL